MKTRNRSRLYFWLGVVVVLSVAIAVSQKLEFKGEILNSNLSTINESKTAEPNQEPTVLRTKELTIEIVKELAKKGENLMFQDFKEYKGMEIGSGLYIMEYLINDKFKLVVGGADVTGKPFYALLEKAGVKKGIEIRTEDIEKFISK